MSWEALTYFGHQLEPGGLFLRKNLSIINRIIMGAEIPEPEIRITSLRVDVSIPKFFSYPKCALNRPIRKADVHFPFLSRYHLLNISFVFRSSFLRFLLLAKLYFIELLSASNY